MSSDAATGRLGYPNIVYIFADDMGYGDVSCLNVESKIKTENLDRLAAEGMVFTDAHSSSAVCTPSRYSVLTGRYCWRSTLKQGVINGYTPHLIEDGRMTVPSFLRDFGYHTACIGKWHLGMDWPAGAREPGEQPDGQSPNTATGPGSNHDVDFSAAIKNGPTDFGFDYYFGISASLDMPPYVYIENDIPTALPDRNTGCDDEKAFWREGPTGSDFHHIEVLPKCTEKAVDYISQRAATEEPFFLYFPLPAPHTPILPTPEYEGKSGTNTYGDFVLQCDGTVGAVMDALDKSRIANNTILIFTSDNGCSPRANYEELIAVGHNPSYIFRGHKADIYEGGHRIPLLLRWPARTPAGETCDDTVCLSDLFATCVDVVGGDLPDDAGEDSVSNLPIWLGKGYTQPIREATVHHSINGSFSLRKGKWKLEMCPGSGGWSYPRPGEEPAGSPPIQLYDLSRDVGEQSNLQAEYPEVVEELKAVLSRYVKNGRSTPGEAQPNTGARHWPQLNWLLESDM